MEDPGHASEPAAGRVLRLLAARFVLWKRGPEMQLPAWPGGTFWSVTRTDQEISVICEEAFATEPVPESSSWRCLEVEGPIPHDAIGVLASLADPLRKAGISILAHSTYGTDFLFVPADQVRQAVDALRDAGHEVLADSSSELPERNP